MYTVYLHKNKINNKIYVGITSIDPKKRWGYGYGYKLQPYFYNAIQKYGWDNFEHIIVKENLTQSEAEQMEIDLISKYNSTNKNNGYNIQNGGYAAGKHSEETKRKLSENHKGLMSGEKHHMYGKHHSLESRNKISEAQYKPVYQYDRYTGSFIAEFSSTIEAEKVLGVPNSHISAICLGKMKTSHGYVFRYKNDTTYKYGEPLSKKELYLVNKNDCEKEVLQYDKNNNFIKKYNTITEAAIATNTNKANISTCLSGGRKTAGGYIWKCA